MLIDEQRKRLKWAWSRLNLILKHTGIINYLVVCFKGARITNNSNLIRFEITELAKNSLKLKFVTRNFKIQHYYSYPNTSYVQKSLKRSTKSSTGDRGYKPSKGTKRQTFCKMTTKIRINVAYYIRLILEWFRAINIMLLIVHFNHFQDVEQGNPCNLLGIQKHTSIYFVPQSFLHSVLSLFYNFFCLSCLVVTEDRLKTITHK